MFTVTETAVVRCCKELEHLPAHCENRYLIEPIFQTSLDFFFVCSHPYLSISFCTLLFCLPVSRSFIRIWPRFRGFDVWIKTTELARWFICNPLPFPLMRKKKKYFRDFRSLVSFYFVYLLRDASSLFGVDSVYAFGKLWERGSSLNSANLFESLITNQQSRFKINTW